MNRNTLLIVDDMEINRVILRTLFEQEYNLLEAENGEQALMMLSQYQDTLAAMLLDVVMPVKDGYAVMADMNKTGLINKIPVIIITSEDTFEIEVRAFDLGASDIIMKPFEPHVVKRRVQNAVELNLHREHLEELVENQAAKLRESTDILMDALSSVIEHRSVESGQHILRIRMFTKILLEDIMRSYPEYDLNERIINIIASASALHDIGKISIPDAILNKPGPLTKEEFDIMKTHSIKGCEILAGLDRMDDKEYLRFAYNICRYHHERWDGKGYPDGLKGDSIPICAQAVSIADAYDALTTDRVYKKAFPPEKAYAMILNGECGAFSPKLLECFKSIREQFAMLSRSYADGRSPKADGAGLAPMQQITHTDEPTTYEYGQMKFAAMLRYADATVMEVNLDNGIYHLVYNLNEDFDVLRTGDNYKESIRNFVVKSVYPDDQPIAFNSIDTYISDFVENGLLKRTRHYRVLHHATGSYVWYEATVLRVDINNPHSHKILVVWKEVPEDSAHAGKADDLPAMQNMLIGIQQCINDQWFTITEMNQGFLNLFGYTRQEIQDHFKNRYIEMIHPDDRQAVKKQFQEQILLGNSMDLEYRIKDKDGRILWLLEKCQLTTDRTGRESINCVLMDMTQVKQAQEALRLTMERHQIIMDQTNDIIFEWNIAGDSLSYSSNWVKKFGYEPISQDIRTRIPQVSHILPEDIPKFVKLMQDVGGGAPYGEAEIRIANADGHYIWCRIRATTQFDHNGTPIKAVGVILDIDSEKRRTQELIDMAERDSLTKLFNKSAVRTRVQKTLDNRKSSEKYAMLIIDLDNFKQVNDSHGHMFGDAVLSAIALELKKLFRTDDIIARIGGDEFLVFMGYNNIKAVHEKAALVIQSFHQVLEKDLQDCPLSCSIGISCCPSDSTDYPALFQSCDQALYYAKQQGKNQFTLFDRTTMAKAFGLNQVSAASTRIESDDVPESCTAGIVEEAFKVLYQAGDLELAVNTILEMVGKKYDVSRVYIFENSADGAYCNNTFEWCNEGIVAEKDSLQNILYSSLMDGHYSDNFNEDGVFYCPDISVLPQKLYEMLAAQGIHSLLQCAIRNDGKFVGYVGFDDCRGKRIWTQAQIDVLAFLSELLSTFLLKKRAQDQALATAQDLQMLLDNQNSWIYVIDPDTYTLKYINAKTYGIAPQARLGMRCYKAFFDRNEPCVTCPARNIRKNINQTMEIFNPVLKVWSLADASFVHWGKEDACLLCCHDITPYMEQEKGRETNLSGGGGIVTDS